MRPAASANPSRDPIMPSNRLSVRSCCLKRAAEAPRASRIAISRLRPTPRAIKSPATFAQAMRRTSRTVPKSMNHTCSVFPVSHTRSGKVTIRAPAVQDCAERSDIVCRLADKDVGLVRFPSRPITRTSWTGPPWPVSSGVSARGIQIWTPGGKANASGITPTTV